MAKPKGPSVVKPGDAPKRGRKAKPKHKDRDLESERRQKDAEAGLRMLSGQAASEATSSDSSTGSVPATGPPQNILDSVPEVEQSLAVKAVQSASRTSDTWRSGKEETSLKGSEEGARKSTLVQSRLAWKTMASPAPTLVTLKVPHAENKVSVKASELKGMPLTQSKLPPRLPKGPAKTPAVLKKKKKKKRKMGLYNFVPKKKAKLSAQMSLTVPTSNNPKSVSHRVKGSQLSMEEVFKPRLSVHSNEALNGRGTEASDPQNPDEGLTAFENVREEYTELPLHTLAQEGVFAAGNTGLNEDRENMESDEALEPPLCSCRMETPGNPDVVTLAEGKCMAVESVDGKPVACRKPIQKQEMMRPSPRIPLLVLCEDHRAGMVKHQSCPGCGVFCRAGTFMECQLDRHISHRFHQNCASTIRGQLFCPHCGEEASQATEVTVPKPPPVSPLSSVTAAALPEDKEAGAPAVNPRADTPVEASTESLEMVLEALEDGRHRKAKLPPKQLFYSAQRGELQQVMHMLVEGVDPNLQLEGERRRTPLHAAAAEGHREICHILVQAGANLDMCDDQQRTSLMDACENNHMETVEYLLKAGASTSHKDIRGSTCLHVVTRGGHIGALQHLLSTASVDVNCKDDGGWTPITWATENLHTEQVKLLLARGADIYARDKEENICLHWAAFAGCADIAQLLLENRSDLHAVNVHGDTPLHIAVRQNQLDCVMLLLSRGADVNLKNKDGETPLECCGVNSKVWSILNTSKKLTDARRGRDRQGEQLLCRDLSRGYEDVPVSCVNGVDQEPCPIFKYVPENCFTTQVNIDENITHLQHCACKDDCSSSGCICGQLSIRCWYDREGRLLQEFCRVDPPFLFECNHACSCWRTCRNRVVQNRLRVRLQVFRTAKMGWGVRALQDIPEGAFICEFAGEIISDGEANARDNDSYMFNLDNKVGDVYCIDAQVYGNVGRFLNHLCEPNLFPVRVFTKHQDLRFPRIALFSCKAIRAGDELGFDYGDQYWEIKQKYFSCRCSSPKCRHSGAGLESSRADRSAQAPAARSSSQVAGAQHIRLGSQR